MYYIKGLLSSAMHWRAICQQRVLANNMSIVTEEVKVGCSRESPHYRRVLGIKYSVGLTGLYSNSRRDSALLIVGNRLLKFRKWTK